MTTQQLVQRVTSFAHELSDDGVGAGDYVEQITFLLFLKMSDEAAGLGEPRIIPEDYDWRALLYTAGGVRRDGPDLEVQYTTTLLELGKHPGLVGVIYRKAQNRIQNPARLRRLVDLIDEQTWRRLSHDVMGDIYEGLLAKYAADNKSGAGQFFTPRPLIRAIVEVMAPQPGETICDPAVGSGGFLLAAASHLTEHHTLDRDEHDFLARHTMQGYEVATGPARLCAMNLLLHGITGLPDEEGRAGSPVLVRDALANHPGQYFDVVLSNPPFGKRSGVTAINDEGDIEREAFVYERPDFRATTSNKQLNFVQHIRSILKVNGRAAVVVPDNVLFEGGAGEVIRRALLHECDLHTMLRLPTGIFYAGGVKANVLFFDQRAASESPQTEATWIYDLRTNKHFTLKARPLTDEDLADFVRCYALGDVAALETDRFRRYDYETLVSRDKCSLDVFWLKDDSLDDVASLPAPDVLAAEVIDHLESALAAFRAAAEGVLPQEAVHAA